MASAECDDDARAIVVATAADYGRIAAEHGITSTSAMVELASASAWRAIERQLLAQCLADPAAHVEQLKLAQRAGQQARLQLLASLHNESNAREDVERANDQPINVDAIVSEATARAQREAEQSESDDDDDDDDDDEHDTDDDE